MSPTGTILAGPTRFLWTTRINGRMHIAMCWVSMASTRRKGYTTEPRRLSAAAARSCQPRSKKEERHPSAFDFRIASLDLAAGKLTVTFSADSVFPWQGIDVIAVLADDADRSSVQPGENSGHTLSDVAVARSLTQVAALKGAATQSTGQIPMPSLYQKPKCIISS